MKKPEKQPRKVIVTVKAFLFINCRTKTAAKMKLDIRLNMYFQGVSLQSVNFVRQYIEIMIKTNGICSAARTEKVFFPANPKQRPQIVKNMPSQYGWK